jgi:hypothetical protein
VARIKDVDIKDVDTEKRNRSEHLLDQSPSITTRPPDVQAMFVPKNGVFVIFALLKKQWTKV